MKRVLILLLLPYLLFTTTEAKEIPYNSDYYEIMTDFVTAREREVQQIINNLKQLPPANKYGMRKLKTKSIRADFLIRDDSKVIIEKMHIDASAIHPDDRDKKKLLKRFGIDPNESASKIKVGDGMLSLYLNFEGNRLTSIDSLADICW